MKVYISSDHAGFNLKNKLVESLSKSSYEVIDLGPATLDPTDDFPTLTYPLAQKISSENDAGDSKGIVICRNGVGVSIVANKFPNVRCGLSFEIKHAISSRQDDNTNVLALAADYLSDGEAVEIAKTWLETKFMPEERFVRRIEEIKKIEESI